MQKISPDSFEDVFSAELEEIAKRQKKNGTEQHADAIDRKELAGLALSGGGIRSATTSLGALQALKKLGLLGAFDYLSTVSGGGFTGGWWSAWASRAFDSAAAQEEKFFPPDEKTQPERDALQPLAPVSSPASTLAEMGTGRATALQDAERRAVIDPVHHLRLFSNYLTPIKGFLSGDTWRANAVISRNLILTWLVLLPMLFAAVLLAQSYFTAQPNAEMEFLYPYSHFAKDDARAANIAFDMKIAERLDSMVHGGTGIIALTPVHHLRRIAVSEQIQNPFVEIDRNIDSLQKVDSAIVQDVGDKRSSPGSSTMLLTAELSRIEQGLNEWHRTDSAFRAGGITPIAFERASHSYRVALDPDVDSVRVKLASLQSKLIAHRTKTRDNLLFNGTHLGYLAERAVWASRIPVMCIGWIALLICLWMLNSGNKPMGGNILQGIYAFIGGLLVFQGLSWLVPRMVGIDAQPEWAATADSGFEIAWIAGALILLNLVLWDKASSFWKDNRRSMGNQSSLTREYWQKLAKLLEIRRARIVSFHQRLLLGAFLITVLLAFGGFGHEIINYLFFYHSDHTWDFGQTLARAAGIATIVSALAGTGFAARSATAQAGTPARGGKPTSKLKSIFIGMAPPLILLLLLCGISWTSHWVLQDIVFRSGEKTNTHLIALIFAMWLLSWTSLYYAIQELRFRTRDGRSTQRFNGILLSGVIIVQLAMMVVVLIYPSQTFHFGIIWLGLPLLVWAIIAWQYSQEQKNRAADSNDADGATPGAAKPSLDPLKPATGNSRIRQILMQSSAAIFILGFSVLLIILVAGFVEVATLPIDHLFLVAIGATLMVFLIDLVWGVRAPEPGRRANHMPRILLGINITLCTLFLLIPSLPGDPHWGVTHVLEILVSIAFGLVIFIGWRLDPNALSIHAFYRDRIVRAYLGASNWWRDHGSISEVHPNDDIPLASLATCENGAPYHLINTTLNLLGTKSLETAQRHASNFIFSKRHCGSVTTGYRPTEEYMGGTMTLGTAVAISGAAASPNMGSNQVSGATTMLMSLLNVRLGYWAANPGRARWREDQPTLWPYYLLKESLSQTTGFGAFCYLTDGGHFDNTGLYPLIERGCRYIVLCDNGADPNSHFKDLGNALRRCRIDFGVEFDLDGLKDMTSMSRQLASSHWLRGTVKYSEEHLRTLWGSNWDEGLSAEERSKYREGAILVLKPILVGDEPADVLQYGLQFADFPQQSTANQWFSEDQFESYRRLGYWSAQNAFSNTDYFDASRGEKLNAIEERPKVVAASTKLVPLIVGDQPQAITDLAYGAPA
ncbi:MAG TPA: hypothetical protein VFH95_02500 [Candidatus Kapabacteria bacterium]|nr:hypothetical protein [Candidatus Kapabacteria bacterium]